jgi:putative transposase
MITRRCTQRQFLLKPSKKTNQIIAYCVAYAAQVTSVELHALCAMSNHWHAVVSDPLGEIPMFLHLAHKHIAKCLNGSYGRCENLWSSQPTSVVRLEDEATILDKIAYTLANPVAAGLVEYGHQWPGLRTTPAQVAGSTQVIKRPKLFFRRGGTMPKSVPLRIVRPPILREHGHTAFVQAVETSVAAHEVKARTSIAKEGRSFLGRRAVLAQRHIDSSDTREPRRKLNPCIAAGSREVRKVAIERLKLFWADYARAWHAWKSGLRDALFPPGTYAMRRAHCAAVADTA